MTEQLFAGMGKYVIGRDPQVLICLSLGSCVGVSIYDTVSKVGGLAHIMLPEYKGDDRGEHLNKFANVAIPMMFADLIRAGANVGNLVAKVAGGAHMFPGILKTHDMDIGGRNSKAAVEELNKLRIKTAGQDTGGGLGRTLHFDTSTGLMNIKTKEGSKDL